MRVDLNDAMEKSVGESRIDCSRVLVLDRIKPLLALVKGRIRTKDQVKPHTTNR